MHLIGDVANIFATGESEGEMAAGSDGGRMSGTGSEGGIPSPISSPRLSPNKRQSRDSEGSFDWSLPGTGEDSGAASLKRMSAPQIQDLRRENRALAMERDDLLARVQELEQAQHPTPPQATPSLMQTQSNQQLIRVG